MLPEYLELASLRAKSCLPGYKQPEDYHYDFKDWVSPFTKGAHALGGVSIVLQDWSSADKLSEGVDPIVQELGRDPRLKTNRTLDRLLKEALNLSVNDVYATNVFPFIKQGNISSPIPRAHVLQAAKQFVRLELEMVRPSVVIALGKMPSLILPAIGIKCIALPHPAARISFERHLDSWRKITYA